MRFLLAIFVATSLLSTDSFAQSQTGEFETHFTERNPSIDKKEILRRLNRKDPGGDYDLASQAFQAYVPSVNQPLPPRGLIYWINFKDADRIPADWKPLLDQLNLVFIVSKSAGQEDWVRASLALDAIHNAKKQFAVDESRVFLFTLAPPENVIGQKMGLAFPDVFMGFVYIWNQRYFRPIPIPGDPGMSYGTAFTRAPAPQFGIAKTRTHVLIGDPSTSAATRLIYKAYLEDGFKQASYLEATREEIHYPDLSTVWFEEVMKRLDAAPTTHPAATTAPASAPANEYASQLSLARSYISLKRYDLARQKLQALLAKNPDEPVAKQAKALLQSIEGK